MYKVKRLKYRKVAACWLSVALLVALVAVLAFATAREPTFEGRSLSFWLAEGLTIGGDQHRATAALKVFDKRALPHLVRMVSYHESPPRRWIRKLLSVQP